MEITGKIKKIDETKTFGASGFRKREMVVTTNEQYPQMLMVEFVQDNCDKLDSHNVGDDVKIGINLRGREWINPEGKAVYFNSIQGWRIEMYSEEDVQEHPTETHTATVVGDGGKDPDDGLPF